MSGYKLNDYLSAYEGIVPITIIHSIDGDICHGLLYSEIRDQLWYERYKDKYVISFKVIRDRKVNNKYVLLLLM